MTTMAKCPECNALLLRPGGLCPTCADRHAAERTREAREKSALRQRTVRAIVDPKAAQEWKKITMEVKEYRDEHPNASMREACCAILERRGILSKLPEPLKSAADDQEPKF